MSGRALNILLVEDNPDHAELVRRNLEEVDVAPRLYHVEDGAAAVDFIFGAGAYANRADFPEPDLVLLDLRLPRVDGLEVLRQLKDHPALRRIPVVVLTTSEAERDVALAAKLQANFFVTKPVEAAHLAQLVREFGARPPAPTPPRPQLELALEAEA